MITSYFKRKSAPESSQDDEKASATKRPFEEDSIALTRSTSSSDVAALDTTTASKTSKRTKPSAAAIVTTTDLVVPSTDHDKNDKSTCSSVAALLAHVTEPSWRTELDSYFSSSLAFQRLADYVARERSRHTIYPSAPETFTALNVCSLDQIKVVIVGQDPYHGPNQAHGLAFSVGRTEKIPPSLRNIYKELLADGQIRSMPTHGHLINWAKQGVLMLNTTLTVRSGQANSHSKAGWHLVTDRIIQSVSTRRPVVFLLWGLPAKEKTTKALSGLRHDHEHVIIQTSHPSPLGATKTKAPFMGSKCFRRCNEALAQLGHDPINWNVDDVK